MQVAIAFWLRVQRRAAQFTPDIARAILRAFKLIADQLSEKELARFIVSGDFDKLFEALASEAKLDTAFTDVSQKVQDSVVSAVKTFAKDVPAAGKIHGALVVGFNVLNDDNITAVRALNTRVMQTLTSDVREVVRAVTEQGLRDGVAPAAIARDIRASVGLAPNQLDAVTNFQNMLEAGDRTALSRVLRDRRYDKTLEKALGRGGTGLDDEQVVKMVDAYRARFVAFHADTVARTAALNSMKIGQHITWTNAVQKGFVKGQLMKRWVGVKDDRERASHLEMEGDTVPYDQPYSNGQMTPGDTEYNCRCVSYYFQER